MYRLSSSNQPNECTFETEQIRGKIGSEGQQHGFRDLEFKANGSKPLNPSLYLGHIYRLLADGRFMIQARDHPHAGRIEEDRVVIRWEPLPEHPASIEAVYQVSGENTLDFTITCRLEQAMERYELYLSHYFAPAFRPYLYLKAAPYQRSEEPVLWPAEVSEFFRGYYLAYPRDREALMTLFDGRWHGDHPVPFAVAREFAAPVGVYASAYEKLAVVMTARADECFCLYSTYNSPDGRDNILHHNSFYFGMFNEDLPAGAERTAHIRYHLVPWDTVSPLPLELAAGG
ncbi:MAG: hypothetical protein HUU35_19015 [Armatimonadetes bacterium]|nr:hypothetical protein [Armatimonadota bacterium]